MNTTETIIDQGNEFDCGLMWSADHEATPELGETMSEGGIENAKG